MSEIGLSRFERNIIKNLRQMPSRRAGINVVKDWAKSFGVCVDDMLSTLVSLEDRGFIVNEGKGASAAILLVEDMTEEVKGPEPAPPPQPEPKTPQPMQAQSQVAPPPPKVTAPVTPTLAEMASWNPAKRERLFFLVSLVDKFKTERAEKVARIDADIAEAEANVQRFLRGEDVSAPTPRANGMRGPDTRPRVVRSKETREKQEEDIIRALRGGPMSWKALGKAVGLSTKELNANVAYMKRRELIYNPERGMIALVEGKS